MAEIRVQVDSQEVGSVITRASVDSLGLKVGDDVVLLIKSTSVMVGKP